MNMCPHNADNSFVSQEYARIALILCNSLGACLLRKNQNALKAVDIKTYTGCAKQQGGSFALPCFVGKITIESFPCLIANNVLSNSLGCVRSPMGECMSFAHLVSLRGASPCEVGSV
jgi:hypothetical protein